MNLPNPCLKQLIPSTSTISCRKRVQKISPHCAKKYILSPVLNWSPGCLRCFRIRESVTSSSMLTFSTPLMNLKTWSCLVLLCKLKDTQLFLFHHLRRWDALNHVTCSLCAYSITGTAFLRYIVLHLKLWNKKKKVNISRERYKCFSLSQERVGEKRKKEQMIFSSHYT